MTENKAQVVAEQLGEIKSLDAKLQAEIERLRHKNIVELEQVCKLHDWLKGKRRSRQSCRIVGESRTGKTVACDSYRLRHKPIQEVGKPPIVPVVYIQPPQECSSGELFRVIPIASEIQDGEGNGRRNPQSHFTNSQTLRCRDVNY